MVGVYDVAKGFDVEVRHAAGLQDVILTDTLSLLVILIQLVCALLHHHSLALLAAPKLLLGQLEDLIFVAILLAHFDRRARIDLLVQGLDHICRPTQSGTNLEARVSHASCLCIYGALVRSFTIAFTIVGKNLHKLITLLFEDRPAKA